MTTYRVSVSVDDLFSSGFTLRGTDLATRGTVIKEDPMAVRAKFYVVKRTEHAHADSQVDVLLRPVVRGEDNKSWAKYTPSGELTMTILNKDASDQFVAGGEFYVDFTPAPKGEEG